MVMIGESFRFTWCPLREKSLFYRFAGLCRRISMIQPVSFPAHRRGVGEWKTKKRKFTVYQYTCVFFVFLILQCFQQLIGRSLGIALVLFQQADEFAPDDDAGRMGCCCLEGLFVGDAEAYHAGVV